MVNARTFISLLLIPVVLAAGLSYYFYNEGQNITAAAFTSIPPLQKAGDNLIQLTSQGPLLFSAVSGQTLVAGFTKSDGNPTFVTNYGIVTLTETGFVQIATFDNVKTVHGAEAKASQEETIIMVDATLTDNSKAQIETRINTQGIVYATTVRQVNQVEKLLGSFTYNSDTQTLTTATKDEFVQIIGDVVQTFPTKNLASVIVAPDNTLTASYGPIPRVSQSISLAAKRIGASAQAEVLFSVPPQQTAAISTVTSPQQLTLQQAQAANPVLRAVAPNPFPVPLNFRIVVPAPLDKTTSVIGSIDTVREGDLYLPNKYNLDEWLDKIRRDLEIPEPPKEPEPAGGDTEAEPPFVKGPDPITPEPFPPISPGGGTAAGPGDTVAPFEPLPPTEPPKEKDKPCDPDEEEIRERLLSMPDAFSGLNEYVTVEACGIVVASIPCDVYYSWKDPGAYISGMADAIFGVPPELTKIGLGLGLFLAGEKVPIPLCDTVDFEFSYEDSDGDGKRETVTFGLSVKF